MVSPNDLSKLFSTFPSFTLAEIVGLISATILLHSILLAFYRLTLHPLARYPGRPIDKITAWPHVIRCYTGTRHVRLLELHQRYGHVVRTSPNWLEFDTSGAQQAIYRDRMTNTIKHDWYTLEPSMTGETSVQTVIDKKEHDFRRRVLAPAFSDAALRNHEAIIDISVRRFLDKTAGKDATTNPDGWTQANDFSIAITRYGFDATSDLAFGASLDMTYDQTQQYIPGLLIRLSHFIYYAAYLPFPRLVRWLVGTRLMAYIDDSAEDGFKFAEKSAGMLAERQALENDEEKKEHRKDIFHYLINSKDPETGQGFTQQQLIADSVLLLAAGSDGVAVTLAATLFYLLYNPATLAKLTSEVRSAFQNFDDVRGPGLYQLSYLDGVVNEALRLAPPIPSALPRTVLAGGLNVDGLHVPAGTTVGVSPYTMHHNETYFPDSFAFRPERWIESADNKPDSVSAAKRALATFGGGRFGCAGRNVAIVTIKLALGKMLWAYDVRAADGVLTGGGSAMLGAGRTREGEYQMVDCAVAARSGPIVQFKARETLP